MGASGSLRYLGSYAPFLNDPLSYTPGLEGRLRGGADRLLGERSRLVLGLTLSTFSTDVFSGSSVIVPGRYSPRTRFIGEIPLVRVLDRATLTVSAWDFYRLAGLSNAGPNPETKEDVFNGEVRLTCLVTTRLQLEPLIAFRQSSPAAYRGGPLKSGGLLARAGLTDRLSAAVAGRYDDGWILARGRGFAFVKGYDATRFLRYER